MAWQEDVRQPDRVRLARQGYRALAWLLAIGVAVQVFLAGLGIFVGPAWWSQHRTFVHALEVLPPAMLIFAFVGRLPTALRWLTAAPFLLIMVQYATINIGFDSPAVAAYHPVNAVLLFWLAVTLAQRVGHLGNAPAPPTR